MIYTVECVNALTYELHIIAEEITAMPVIIKDPRISPFHKLNEDLFEDKKLFKIDPEPVQICEWLWETKEGEIKIFGPVDKKYFPFCMEFWLKL